MNVTYDFKGKVAFVTGAGQGMGLASARAYAAAGATVVLTDIDEDVVKAEAEKIVAAGGTASGLACNVSNEAEVAEAISQTILRYGRHDMAFNNAGVQAPASDLADQPAEEFDRVVAINLRGMWASMKHELKHMRDQGSGVIVNMGSAGGLVGNLDLAAYNATKHGVLGLTKSAALRYARQGIRINAVCPATINTPMVARMIESRPEAMEDIMRLQVIGRLGEADEVAAAVIWLSSDGASFVHGTMLAVDGGMTAN